MPWQPRFTRATSQLCVGGTCGDASRCKTPQRLGRPGKKPALELLCSFLNPRSKGGRRQGGARGLGKSPARLWLSLSLALADRVASSVGYSCRAPNVCTGPSMTILRKPGMSYGFKVGWEKRRIFRSLPAQNILISKVPPLPQAPRKWRHSSEKGACVFSASTQ